MLLIVVCPSLMLLLSMFQFLLPVYYQKLLPQFSQHTVILSAPGQPTLEDTHEAMPYGSNSHIAAL